MPSHMRFGVTPHLNLSRCRQVLPPLPLSISKPNYNVIIASSSVSVSLQPLSVSNLWTTSLTFHPTPLAPEQVTKNDWGDFDPLKQIAALKGDWMDCILLECGH